MTGRMSEEPTADDVAAWRRVESWLWEHDSTVTARAQAPPNATRYSDRQKRLCEIAGEHVGQVMTLYGGGEKRDKCTACREYLSESEPVTDAERRLLRHPGTGLGVI
jgi:hypothetical protein